ncbi:MULTISPECIES: RNA polymerase sigma factor [Paenibacillus]|uniref:RNA polymerase sigma factor n=1 Tax=Paenibacillus TaxID=44249 RepID=UPI0022B8F697|nr:RNA polymerase sigma factor [Paenibacillus caseinilyticus]MCZ8523384.1 RNA polymerase sigma factor [Paenibacillus caseinilyticus]
MCSEIAGDARLSSREGRGRPITEEAWIARIIAGDREAFRELVERYGADLYKAVYSVLHSAKDAEDVTQEVLLKIYSSLPQYRHGGLKTWLTRIAVHKAIDYKRSRDRKKEQLTGEWEETQGTGQLQESPVEAHVMRRDRRERVRESLERLPGAYRKVVVAFYLEDKSYQQIAAEQQIAVKTVESKLYRAKQYMRKVWKEEDLE